MEYLKIIIPIRDNSIRELLIAELSQFEFQGFEETEHELITYTSDTLDKEQLEAILAPHNLTYDTAVIPQQNWNAAWEENFQPVIVDDFCTVRADFHKLAVNTPYEIIITPKMSFGTGHHATTQLMMGQMKHLPLTDARVLDFGTGTGILAILSEMLQAKSILAIDNDEWSYENAKENIARNHCKHITIRQGSLELAAAQHFDIILANINRHILLEYMEKMSSLLNKNGLLLISGLLTDDKEIILDAAVNEGFSFIKMTELNNWICILLRKI